MGVSREMTVAALAEPTLALAIFALALGAGSTNLGQIVARTMADPLAAISQATAARIKRDLELLAADVRALLNENVQQAWAIVRKAA